MLWLIRSAVAVRKGADSGDRQQPPEAVLGEYRRRMMLAADRNDLRRLLYELEDSLHQYPGHPQAHMLEDQITTALRYKSRPDARYHGEEPTIGSRPESRSPPYVLLTIGGPLALGRLLYLLYCLLRALLGW